jgi:hypothetical protein
MSNPITSATLGELLKRLYSPEEITMLIQLVSETLAKCCRRGNASLGGSGFFFPIRTRSAHGHAYIAEGADLPDPGQTQVLQAVVLPVSHYGVVKMTGIARAVASNNAAAFAQGFEEQTTHTLESMAWYDEAAFFRDGSGQLTQFNGAVATTVGPHTVDDVSHLRPGMKVDIIDITAFTRHNADIVIQDVDWVNRTVTFETAVAAAVDDNDQIFIAGSQDATGAPVVREPLGLEASLAATGVYLGIDRGVIREWQARRITASRPMDEDLIQRGRTFLTQITGLPLSGISSAYALLTHPQVAEGLFKLVIPRVQYSMGGQYDLLNTSEVKLGNMPIITTPNCPSNRAYLGDWKYSQSLYLPGGELKMDEEHNGSALKWVANKDSGLVYFREYKQWVVKKPNAFVVYDSLSEMDR